MSLLIASQFENDINEVLRGHSSRPIVVDTPEDRPWAAAEDADVLLVRPSPAWRGAPRPTGWPGRLRWIYSGSVGVDRYPAWLLEAPLVTCARGVASREIAEYVIAAIYAQVKDLEGVRARSPAEWSFKPQGRIAGSTIGIIGLGDIGTEVARVGLALGARVVAARRRRLPSPIEGVELVDDLGTVVAAADHLVLALPSTTATHKLIDAALLARARPSLHLVNIARGAVLDQEALVAALDAGRLGFATLDVTDPEPLPAGHRLWTHPLVRLTPHISSNFTAVRDVMVDKIIVNLDRLIGGDRPLDLVDATHGY